MSNVRVVVNLDFAKASSEIVQVLQDVQPDVTKQFVEDANYYCREQTGRLIKSSQAASNWATGEARWDTPYAQEVYYTGFPRTNVNPNASLMWAEKAASENLFKYAHMYTMALRGK